MVLDRTRRACREGYQTNVRLFRTSGARGWPSESSCAPAQGQAGTVALRWVFTVLWKRGFAGAVAGVEQTS
jgi:hypothetical protein